MFEFVPFKLIGLLAFPRWLNNLMGIYYGFRDEYFNFFANLTRTIVQQRKQQKSPVRNDLVQLLIDAFVYENELENTSYKKLAADMDQDGK